MDNFNNQSSHFVHSADPSNSRNVNGFIDDGDDQHTVPYGQGWSYSQVPSTAQNASHPSWPDSAGQRVSSNNDHFNQSIGTAAPLTTDPAPIYDNNGFGAEDRLGREQNHFILPANLSNPTQSGLVSNAAPAHIQPNTISPEALQSRPISQNLPNQQNKVNGREASTSKPVTLPKGIAAGKFLVASLDSLKQVADVRSLHRYVDVATESIDLPVSGSNIPAYVPRKSRNQIKRMLGSNQGYTATVNKKLSTGSGFTKSVTVPTYVDASGKLSSKSNKSEQSTPDESSEESEYESSDDEPEKPPYPTVRPTNPQAAVRHDALKALWHPAGAVVSGDSIRDGMKQFWEVLQTIRDRWKSDLANVADAEKAKKEHEVPLLKERVKTQRDLLEVALKAAIQHGHKEVLDNFGQYVPAMGAFAFLLQDRGKDNDYNGTFSRAILEFLVLCKSLDTALLDKSLLKRMVDRFSKRGDENIKALTKRITSNANAATKKAKEAKTVTNTAAISSVNAARKPSTIGSAGSKRPFAAETDSNQPSKKAASAKAGQETKTGVASPSGKAATTGANQATRQRTTSASAKPSSFVASLQAAKKSAAPVAKAAPQKPAPEKNAPVQTDQTPAFSFASVLADVANPKESRPAEKKQDEPMSKETPQERTKRLRKQARRRLRVSFKPESSLVEVRYFTHDPEEDLGHDASQMRDVGDARSEGKMLKMQSQLMEIDEEDEGESAEGPFSRDWRDPVMVDFESLDDDAKTNNYIPYGGGVAVPETPDKVIQEDREASVLAVFYSDPSEIPMNPKEPSTDILDDASETIAFGEPPEHVMKRIEEVKSRPTAAGSNQVPPDIMSILSQIQTNPALNQQLQKPAIAAAMSAGMPHTAPTFPSSGHMPPQHPNHSFPSSFGGGAPNLDAIMSAMNQQRQPTSPQGHLLNPNQTIPPVSGGVQDVASIVTALQSNLVTQQQQASQVPPFIPNSNQMPYMGQPNNAAMMSNMTAQVQPAGQPYENEERRRWRLQNENETGNVNGLESSIKPHKGKDGGNLPFRVRPCTYWLAGKCNKGDRCTFLHSNPE